MEGYWADKSQPLSTTPDSEELNIKEKLGSRIQIYAPKLRRMGKMINNAFKTFMKVFNKMI